MKTHFFNASTQELLFSTDIGDIAPTKGDVFVSYDTKTYVVMQRTFVSAIIDAAPTTGILNIANVNTKQLSVELQILLMEITPAVQEPTGGIGQ